MRAKLIFVFLSVCWSSSAYAQTGCSVPGSVRVAGLEVTGAGRVEVCQDGVWGTVCSSSEQWGLKNAQVVCRSLGFYAAVTAIPQDSLVASLRADTSVPSHLTNVECNGSEDSLTQCSHSTDVSDCSFFHFTDVAVVCAAAGTQIPVPVAGDVRLLGDAADYRGAVEYYDGILGWIGVCADSSYSDSWMSSRAAQIVCTQLGFQGGRPFVQSAPFLELGVGDMECSRSALTLAECQREVVVFSGSCGSTQAGWVECQETGVEDYSVRLLPGDREGVVEVSFNGRWGTVCDQSWISSSGAQAVCDQLGIESEIAASTTPSTSLSGYMSRLKPFWLSGVSCSNDENLGDCMRNILIGYSSSCSLTTSVYDSAVANCGPPIPNRLSGGAVAGIVLAVLAVVGAGVLAFIYLPDRWKKRHSYSWYRKLTTPSRWCEWIGAWCRSHAPRVRRHPCRNVTPAAPSGGITPSSTNQNREYPPATVTTRQEESSASGTSNVAGQRGTQPPLQPSTSETATRGDGVLSSNAPPPYQAAISYPLAVAPPAYSEPLPPIGFSGPQSDEIAKLPYPSAVGTDPAYPPPLQGPGQNLPYPS